MGDGGRFKRVLGGFRVRLGGGLIGKVVFLSRKWCFWGFLIVKMSFLISKPPPFSIKIPLFLSNFHFFLSKSLNFSLFPIKITQNPTLSYQNLLISYQNLLISYQNPSPGALPHPPPLPATLRDSLCPAARDLDFSADFNIRDWFLIDQKGFLVRFWGGFKVFLGGKPRFLHRKVVNFIENGLFLRVLGGFVGMARKKQWCGFQYQGLVSDWSKGAFGAFLTGF
jgi:hypothetical protein